MLILDDKGRTAFAKIRYLPTPTSRRMLLAYFTSDIAPAIARGDYTHGLCVNTFQAFFLQKCNVDWWYAEILANALFHVLEQLSSGDLLER
jgi:hypothetical protein